MTTYEVAVYNSEVRRLVNEGDRHKNLSDDWSSTHYLEVQAPDEDAATAKILAKYPAKQGFVIEAVKAMAD